MGGNTGEIQRGSERELYKYINHQEGTTTKSKYLLLVGVREKSALLLAAVRNKAGDDG